MQICSFFPSATEILYALELGDSVAGVTFECDYPPEARQKPVVVDTALRPGLTPEEIDRQVSNYASDGESPYIVDLEALARIQPDLVVTQGLCDVCAVGTPHFAKALAELSPPPKVLPLSPHTLADVLADIEKVGDATERRQQAAKLIARLRERIARVQARPRAIPQIACLEWLNPLYNAGHWVPDMVKIAGGCDSLAAPGEYSARITQEAVISRNPEVLVIMPCGYDAQRAREEYRRTVFPVGWKDIRAVRNRRVYAVDASAYFSRPGPRLIDGIEILYALFHQHFSESLPPASWLEV